ncbi:MAG: tRNA lysidine(34) synthetase TilS [Ignavibacteria bacterium]|nr:tRNA lysidine(34) synthetase TilS [Ignavibacteria bacterium]
MIKTIDQKILKFIDEEILLSKGDKVVVALSGGADSIFLLSFLLKYKKRFDLKLSAFHLNHNLRGNEAIDDEKFCRSFTAQNNVEYFSVSKNVKELAKKNKISVEEAGRKLRYSELERIANKNFFNKIATAHNANDNTETVLLNLIKGTGLKGVAGIPVKRNNIIRPILTVTKDEILSYLGKKKIPYRIDSSNLSSEYERNFLRNEIIPGIKANLNTKLDFALLKSSKVFRNISSVLDNQINAKIIDAVKFEGKQLLMNIDEILKLDKNLIGEFFKKTVPAYFFVELSNENIKALTSLLKKQKGRSVTLIKGLTAYRESKNILISKRKKFKKKEIEIAVGKSKKFNGGVISVSKVLLKNVKKNNDRSIEYISGDDISGKYILRTWKDGDRYYTLGMKGSKKLSDFLTEQRIPSYKKKEQLVLINSGKIVWVVGLRLDDMFKLNANSKKVYKLCWKQKAI